MTERKIESFEEFWPFYVGEHKKPTTRLFHFVGTTAAVGCLASAVIFRKPWLVPAALVAGYGPAWFSHFFIEKNKPASFKYPLWSLKADFVMWSKMIRGEMQAEVDRIERAEREKSEKSAAEAEATSSENGANVTEAFAPATATVN